MYFGKVFLTHNNKKFDYYKICKQINKKEFYFLQNIHVKIPYSQYYYHCDSLFTIRSFRKFKCFLCALVCSFIELIVCYICTLILKHLNNV